MRHDRNFRAAGLFRPDTALLVTCPVRALSPIVIDCIFAVTVLTTARRLHDSAVLYLAL